jgi:hypothetical protein
LLRFPNDISWTKCKLYLSDLKIVNVFKDEVFGFVGDDYISIKRDSLPKDFAIKK